MRRLLLSLAVAASAAFAPAHAEVLGSVKTSWNAIGANDTIEVSVFDDLAVPGVACYLSRARTGGIAGTFGLATDTSDASIACRKVGPITADLSKLPAQEQVFSVKTNPLFKTMQVVRMPDAKRRVIAYLVYSTHLVDGSPKNSVSVVAVDF